MEQERRVVITGLGVATPLGIGIEPVWDALVSKTSGVRRIQAFDASGLGCAVGGEVPDFKMPDFVPKTYRKSTKVMARDIMLAVVAAYEAVKDAGLKTKCLIDRGEADGPSNIDPTRFGANIGAGLICADLHELAGALATAADDDGEFQLSLWGQRGMENLTPLWLLKFLPNMLACHVTIVHDAQAPSNTITCGEASAQLAVGEAFRSIARGDVDACICGGAESKINPMSLARPQLLGYLRTDANDHPESACRPFGSDRVGTVPSEGAGLLMLESLDHAKARGARIYAEVAGFGASANTHDWRTPDPSGTGLAMAVRNAFNDARITAADVDLIGTFGSGTQQHDASEAAALRSVFGERLAEIPAMAIKGGMGTCGAGSGAIDLAVGVMAMHNNTVPPSLNTDTPDSACGLRLQPDAPIDARINAALNVSYAMYGGQNAALVIKRFKE